MSNTRVDKSQKHNNLAKFNAKATSKLQSSLEPVGHSRQRITSPVTNAADGLHLSKSGYIARGTVPSTAGTTAGSQFSTINNNVPKSKILTHVNTHTLK